MSYWDHNAKSDLEFFECNLLKVDFGPTMSFFNEQIDILYHPRLSSSGIKGKQPRPPPPPQKDSFKHDVFFLFSWLKI